MDILVDWALKGLPSQHLALATQRCVFLHMGVLFPSLRQGQGQLEHL